MKISEFLSKNFHFLVEKFSVYLNGLVFVMYCELLIGIVSVVGTDSVLRRLSP